MIKTPTISEVFCVSSGFILLFLCVVDFSFICPSVLWLSRHSLFLSTWKRVLIGCFFFLAWRHWWSEIKNGKTPFESERHTKAFWVTIGSAKALQTFPGYASFFAAVGFCIIKIREMWIHLLELYVVISLLVRLISILSLDWKVPEQAREIRWSHHK